MEAITLPRTEGVVLQQKGKKSQTGTLLLTASHLIFETTSSKIFILHSHIWTVEKLPTTYSGSPLKVLTKTFRLITLLIPKEKDSHELLSSLIILSKPLDVKNLLAFHYRNPDSDEPCSHGWNLNSLLEEYHRMGIPTKNWLVSNINANYKICETYPSMIVVPSNTASPILAGSAKFRSRGRLPVLTYLHSNGTAMCRCSQPLVGFNSRGYEDEAYLRDIARSSPAENSLYVADTRPKVNALVNRAQGKGYENQESYQNTTVEFHSIDNIHVMRNSIQKLIEALEKSSTCIDLQTSLVQSGWLKHIHSILESSVLISRTIDNDRVNVLVHCSDGWDRTSQVCSLVGLILDPYYRTFKGFQALIEKDWLAFGHRFTERNGFIDGDAKEVSPVFAQFLDCCWQLMNQFPQHFEFDEKFLILIHEELYACRFGTFIGSSERERRKDLKLSECTYSLWEYVDKFSNFYKNPFYDYTNDVVLQPDISASSIQLWTGLYNRFDSSVHVRESPADLYDQFNSHNKILKLHLQVLQKKYKEMLKKTGSSLDASDLLSNFTLKEVNVNPDFEEFIERRLCDKIPTSSWQYRSDFKQCVDCKVSFDYLSSKINCYGCGLIFCKQCVAPHDCSDEMQLYLCLSCQKT